MKPLLLLLIFAVSFLSSGAQINKQAADEIFNKSNFAGKGGYYVSVFKTGDNVYQNPGGLSPDKEIPIASASKWLAGAVIMRLVEKGYFTLDDRISKYIPSFNTNEKKNITVRQCFSHTSGLPGGQEAFDEFMGKRTKSYEKIIDDIAAVELTAAPGTTFNYGGMSMQVAGRVAEITTGKSFHQLLKEELTDPLEMKNTHYSGYRFNLVPRIAGGAVSTVNDYLKFLSMIINKGAYNGKRFLSETSLQIMLSDQTNAAKASYSPFGKYSNQNATALYGIGNWVMKMDNKNINASPGAFGFTPWVDMQKGYIGVIATVSSFQKVMPVFSNFLKVVE